MPTQKKPRPRPQASPQPQAPDPNLNTKDPYPSEANPKDLLGVRKAPLHLVPPALRIAAAPALADGARKYGAYNWRRHPVKFSVYYSAMMRHMEAYWDGEDVAADSGLSHLSHAIACLAIAVDAQAAGNLIDDRPERGAASRLIAEQDETKRDRSLVSAEGALIPAGSFSAEGIPLTQGSLFALTAKTQWRDS